MINLIGTHECKADAKGRLMFSSAFKKQLSDVLQDGFVVKRAVFQPCLELYPLKEWNLMMDKINTLNRFKKKNNDFIRRFTAGVKLVELDATGRILIPKDLVEFASIKKQVVMSSSVNIIEIWDKVKYEKAIDYYTQIISSLNDKSDMRSDLLYRRGGSYERLGNYEKSDEDLLHSLRINPDDAYVLNYLAYSWLERDYKIDEAFQMLEKAYATKSEDPYIIDSIGWAYYLIDNYVEAEKYLKRAVELMKANEHLFVERMEQTEYVRPKSKCYILKDHNTGLYKIGKSVNPVFREKTLQSEKPTIEAVKIFKQNHEDELHKKYNKHRVRGEWFKLNKIQLKYICRTYA